MNSRVKDDLVQSLKSFLPFEVVNPNPSNRYDKLLTYIKESDVPDNVNLFYPDKLALVGNLGIGTRNPVRGLHLEGDSGTSAIRFKTTGGEWDFAPFWSAFDDGNFALNRVSGSGNIIIPSGNVGIGISNPSYTLDLDGGTTVQERIRVGRGSDDTRQFMTLGWDNISVHRTNVPLASTQTSMSFNQVGSDGSRTVMHIDNVGNVGINETNPSFPLQVNGIIRATDGSDIVSLQIGTQAALFMRDTANYDGIIWPDVNGLNFRAADTASSPAMTIDSSGKVGIGTDSPNQKLVVSDSGTYGLEVNPTGNQIDLFAYNRSASLYHDMRIDANEFIFRTGNPIVERIRILSDGNIGIGEPSPDTKLHISGSGNVAGKVVSTDAAAVWVADSISTESSILSFTTAGANAWKFQKAATTGNLEIRNSTDATKFTMLDSGNVGLGVVPVAGWSSTYTVLQIGQDVALWGAPAGAQAALSSNLYYDGSGYKYLNSSRAASQIYLTGGQFGIQSAASGTAGQAASLATRLHMTNAGRFFINAGALTTTNSTANLNIATGGSSGGLKLIAGFTPGNGNDLGAITFAGNDSANNNAVGEASITAKAMGAHSGTTAPAALLFSTKPSSLGPGSAPIERMRITSDGNISVNDTHNTAFMNTATAGKYIGVASNNSDALFIAHSSGQGVGYFGYNYGNDRLIIATDNGSGGNSIQFSVNAGTTSNGTVDNLASAAAAMTIDSSGNIGINTDAPSFSTIDGYGQLGIHIKGEKDSNQSPVIRLEETGSSYGAFEIRSNRVGISSGNILTIGEGADAFLTLQADESNGDTARRGYIGIGTTNPLQKLDVRGYASLLQGGGWGTTWTAAPSSPLYVGIGDNSTFNSGIAAIHAENKGNRGNIANSIGSDLLRLEYNDRDGVLYNRYGAFQIGNFTARSVTTGDDVMMMQLEGIPRSDGVNWQEWPGIQIIANNPNSGGGALYLAHARGSTIGSNTTLLNGDNLGFIGFSGANGTDIQTGATIYAQANGPWSGTNQGTDIVFQTTANNSTAYPTERVRIQSHGTVRILHDATGTGTDHIQFSDRTDPDYRGGIRMASNGDLAFYIGFGLGYNPACTIDRFRRVLIGYTSSNGSYNLQVNSQIFATNSTIATSDGRYKEDIQTISNATDLVSRLNPVQFKWKSHSIHNFNVGKTDIGFIAQEVQEVLSDTDYKDSIVVINQSDEEEFMGMSETKIIPLLTAALQEAITKIETLEAKVAALEEISK